jgi:DNA-binding protein HU-beta
MAKKATSTKEPAKRKSTPPPPPAPAKTSAGTRSRSASKPAAAKPAARSAGKAAAKPQNKAPAKVAAPTTVTLKHLSAGVVERHGLPKKQADTVVAEVFAQLADHLKAGDRVRIGGLGIIQVKDRPARMGRNPATGEAIQIQASRKIAFRPAKELKEAI